MLNVVSLVKVMKRKFLNLLIFITQRIRKRNCVFSLAVSPLSLSGHHIVIGRATQIDSFSTVASYTYIGDFCSVTRATIGRYVSIGNNVSIGPGEHNLDSLSTSAQFYDNPYDELTLGKCIIESDAWIGVDAIVLRGVRVGFGAVVAANAVVTKDVPDYAVVAGVPAKIIRYRFDEKRRMQLLASEWWLKEKKEAKDLLMQLAQILQKVP